MICRSKSCTPIAGRRLRIAVRAGRDFAFELWLERTGIYSYAAGRSLYGPVLPDPRLHPGWTAITVHWLSTVPECRPDSVFSNLVTGDARAALAQRSREDWNAFLTQRARELVPRGQLVVVGGASARDGMSGAEGLFRMIDAELRALVAGGTLRSTELARIFYPTWNRTPDEFLRAVQRRRAGGRVRGSGASRGCDRRQRKLSAVRARRRRARIRGGVHRLREGRHRTQLLPLDRARPDAGAEAGDRGRVYTGPKVRIAADPATATCRWHTVTLRIVRR